MMARPFQPPSLYALLADEDGTAAARLAAEERIRAQAHEAGRQRGLEEGLARGRGEGEAAGRARLEQDMQAALALHAQRGAAAAAAALEALLRQRDEERLRQDAHLRGLVAAALEAVFPVLLARAAGGEVAALLAAALAEREADGITLHAHPATLDAARQDGFPEGRMPARLRLLPDERMPQGRAEARWADGGLLYDPAALMARVLAVLGDTPADDMPQETQQ
ncbi:hypothetical protein CR162_17070 [Pseudoroseomonas rhizosphaerae]|uniref:Flagellar assembly protein FliH/Type III secretion system HrpE domain-containing protein n=1 Tax=Teichococcus rhizosphaerae TaxID=1335062 RepID=A0A2C7A6T4_9PROT|nr:hypothetical protein [Pseudoroseomonas rhizosphaerae]PHK93699.1 hypothetical protein CR162_17070 [Pseudoroseomonas rhizosphaerae]